MKNLKKLGKFRNDPNNNVMNFKEDIRDLRFGKKVFRSPLYLFKDEKGKSRNFPKLN